jgi:ABC-type enterochelin transport system substrate-binding protein
LKTVRVSLLAVFICFIVVMSACSSKQNSAGVQQVPADQAAASSQSNYGSHTQADNEINQEDSLNQSNIFC